MTGSSAPSSAVPRHGHSRSARRPAFGFVSHATDFSTIFYPPLPPLPPVLQPRCPFDARSFSSTSSFSSFRPGYCIGDWINSLIRTCVSNRRFGCFERSIEREREKERERERQRERFLSEDNDCEVREWVK